ncbi:MAG TPA: hypothetical protein VGL56_12085 [Fimbriimonadaceae bacterium]|jgi:uncharacterized damage-inducible protein DinB
MTAQELLAFEIENIGGQLRGAFAGLPDSLQDDKVCEGGMSPREMLEHLSEAYEATIASSKGEEYEWGTFTVDDKSWDNLISVFWDRREKATEAVLVDDETKLKAGFDYIVAHDAYHVGQLAALRVGKEPGWDFYSIYS